MSLSKSLHWDITRNCNLRCKHCYNAEKYFHKDSDVYIDSEMSLEQCISAVDKIANAGFTHIHFLGGEPLLSPHLFKVIKHAKQYGIIITLNSNACLLTRDIRRLLFESGVDQYAASLDGCTSIINDAIRGEGTFECVVTNMMALSQEKNIRQSALQTA